MELALWSNWTSNPRVIAKLASMAPGSVTHSLGSWNTILSSCVKSDQGEKALELFKHMQEEGVKPDSLTFVRVLNACARLGAFQEGRRVHELVIGSGCESDAFVGSALVDMYAKCGSIENAWKMFCKLPTRDVVSWNVMIAGFVKCAQGHKALELYGQMLAAGVKPSRATFLMVLNACASLESLEEGRLVHADIIQTGCHSDVSVGSSLINMYAKCGSLENAWSVFHKMPTRNVVCWNSMVSGYVKFEQEHKALELFRQMQAQGVKPDSVTFVAVLNACASLGTLTEGRHVHKQIVQSGCESDVFVGSTLVDMYAKCGNIEDAWTIFQKMPSRNVVSWNAMLGAFVKFQQGEKALELFGSMQADGVKPNRITFVTVLSACASSAALEEGRYVHAKVIQSAFEFDLFVGSTLVDMYAKCGSIIDALMVFHQMHAHDVVSWNVMLTGCLKCGESPKVLELFGQMQGKGVKPNHVTFVAVLNACANLAALEQGRCVHGQVIQCGFEPDVYVGSTLVDMYSKCGRLDDAWRVFHRMPTRSVVSWNAMFAGFVKCELGQKVLELQGKMREEGVKPDHVTFVLILNACANLEALDEGKCVHVEIIQSGFELDVCVASTLVDMYVKCGSMEEAWRVFQRMPTRSVVSWTAMLAGCAQSEDLQKVLELFWQMQAEGIQADSATFVRVLNACASCMALDEGKHVHSKIIQSGWEYDVFVGSALVDMYAKCGSIEDAWRVFISMPLRSVVSWNTMLRGLAMHGHGYDAVRLFEEMYQGGVEIDAVTFLCLLSACSHAGLVEEGICYFESMTPVYGISQTIEHYACVVDLLGRAGRLDEAEDILRIEPKINEHSMVLMPLLGACRNHMNVEMGERIAQEVLKLDPDNMAAYVLISNIYGAAGQWGNRDKIHEIVKERGSKETAWQHLDCGG